MSSGLSVAHLGPRSSLGYVLLLNWLTRNVLGWFVALPLIAAVGASGIGALPQADRALFEAGGVWLLELLSRETHALSGGFRASALLALGGLVLRTPVCALLFTASHDPQATLSVAFRRALGQFRRFSALFVLELLGRGLLIGLFLLAASSLDVLTLRSRNEALADLPVIAACLLALILLVGLAILCECGRAFSVVSPKLPFSTVFAAAVSVTWARALELTGSYLLYLGVGALALAGGARMVEALDVARAGAFRVLGVCLTHQVALLAVCWLQAWWVRRVVSLLGPGPELPSASR